MKNPNNVYSKPISQFEKDSIIKHIHSTPNNTPHRCSALAALVETLSNGLHGGGITEHEAAEMILAAVPPTEMTPEDAERQVEEAADILIKGLLDALGINFDD